MSPCVPKNRNSMSSPKLEMSLEHQIPVLVKKTQMSGDHAASQCGLTSLLPMSCGRRARRAAAFARDLHSRLSNLGGSSDDEKSWLTRDANATNRPTTSTNKRELDTFYDFEIECESPSSPVDEHPRFSERSPTKENEPIFYDIDCEVAQNEPTKILLQDKAKNGFRFSTAFYTDSSPIKLQPVARENGHTDKPLYSPITFEGCVRQNSLEEIDCTVEPPDFIENRLNLPALESLMLDSNSEFESAKSDPSDGVEDNSKIENSHGSDITGGVETLSLAEIDIVLDDDLPKQEAIDAQQDRCNEVIIEPLDKITSEVSIETEIAPAPKIELSLLSAEINGDKVEQSHNERDGEDDWPQRVRRCSSLKTGKTPPGTPGRKKIVRFADVLGLDLADVKTFMDEIPVIPKSAFDDLTGCDVACSPPVRTASRLGALTLVPLFQLPREITDKLETLNVSLESARVCDGVHVTICGSVRVRNLDFHKTVHVRYTMNRWKTYTDLQATYVQGSCDGFSDRFQFVLYAPAISSGQRLECAVRFLCKGQQYWDNNCGANYCFDCLALGAVTQSTTISGPLHPTVDWHPSFY